MSAYPIYTILLYYYIYVHLYTSTTHTILLYYILNSTPKAMYATIGYIVPEYVRFPGYLSPSLGLKFSDVPNGLAALSKRLGHWMALEGDSKDL